MVDQFIGLLLLGLGLKSPAVMSPDVKGETTAVQVVEDRREGSTSSGSSNVEVKPTIRARIEERHDAFEAKRQERKAELEARKAELSAELKKKKEEFETKRKTLRNKVKAELLVRLNNKLDEINGHLVERMREHLEKIQEVLGKASTWKDEAKAKGKNVSAVEAAITTAQQKIADAEAALDTQEIKEYVITITTEEKLKNDFGKARSQMEADLKVARDALAAARKSVHDVLRLLAQLRGELEPPTPAPTAVSTVVPTAVTAP